MHETVETKRERISWMTWLIRMLKGALVGIGAILPGLSGGVLMVIFGIYDPLLNFLAHFPKRFRYYFSLFLPIGIGGLLGILLFSGAVSAAFGSYAAQFISLFIGFVAGTIPALWATAGKKGRGSGDYWALAIATLIILALMLAGDQEYTSIEPNFMIWIASGVLVGLGFVVPGLSPSNFLIYLGMYSKMTDGIARFDLSVIVPLFIGVLLAILLFAKLVSMLFARFYSTMYHIILGTVIGSSIAIFPANILPALGVEGLAASSMSFPLAVFSIILMFILGLMASLLFSRLEARYSPDDRRAQGITDDKAVD